MDNVKKKMTELAYDNELLQDEILLLKQSNEALIQDKKSLKLFIKKNKLLISGYVRQGLRYLDIQEPYFAIHYYVLKVEGIPLTLDILDVQELIESVIGDSLAPNGPFPEYKMRDFNYSERGQCWYVQIEKVIDTGHVS